MVTKFPPKNYFAMEYPLPHNFEYQFGLSPETATTNSTICSLLQSREGLTAVESIEVNPSNSAFGEDTGPVCQPDSIIPRMNISFDAQLNHILTETDKIKYLKFNYLPIYQSFKDFEAKDNKTDVAVESILELVDDNNTKRVYPLFNGVDLPTTYLHPFSTKPIADAYGGWGLTTDGLMEGVTFDEELMWDALSYYSNSSMLAKVMGSWRTALVTEHKPFHFTSNNYTNPSVKRMNEFTFCGILFHVPLVSTPKQYYKTGDITEATAAIEFNVNVRFDEWNSQFDQTSV